MIDVPAMMITAVIMVVIPVIVHYLLRNSPR